MLYIFLAAISAIAITFIYLYYTNTCPNKVCPEEKVCPGCPEEQVCPATTCPTCPTAKFACPTCPECDCRYLGLKVNGRSKNIESIMNNLNEILFNSRTGLCQLFNDAFIDRVVSDVDNMLKNNLSSAHPTSWQGCNSVKRDYSDTVSRISQKPHFTNGPIPGQLTAKIKELLLELSKQFAEQLCSDDRPDKAKIRAFLLNIRTVFCT